MFYTFIYYAKHMLKWISLLVRLATPRCLLPIDRGTCRGSCRDADVSIWACLGVGSCQMPQSWKIRGCIGMCFSLEKACIFFERLHLYFLYIIVVVWLKIRFEGWPWCMFMLHRYNVYLCYLLLRCFFNFSYRIVGRFVFNLLQYNLRRLKHVIWPSTTNVLITLWLCGELL